MKNYYETLPEGYTEIYHIDAKDKKTGLVFNLAAFGIMIAVIAVAVAVIIIGVGAERSFEFLGFPLLVMVAGMILYVVLHELLHGVAYKALTGRRLTFGMSWSCAFCGVPDIYVSRRTALVALVTPFAVFTLVLIPLAAVLYFISLSYFFSVAMILAMHLGGCIGDLYMLCLLLFKFKDRTLLMKDTGPEQYIYGCIERE